MFDVITFGIYHISRSKWSGQVFAIRYSVQKCNPQFNSVNIPVQKIANIHLKGNSRPTIWGSITFFLAMQICVRVKLGFLIDKIIPSLWTCHQKMELVIVIGWSVFQGSVQISQATVSRENIYPYSLKKKYLETILFSCKNKTCQYLIQFHLLRAPRPPSFKEPAETMQKLAAGHLGHRL